MEYRIDRQALAAFVAEQAALVEAVPLLEAVRGEVRVDGLMTHFASSEVVGAEESSGVMAEEEVGRLLAEEGRGSSMAMSLWPSSSSSSIMGFSLRLGASASSGSGSGSYGTYAGGS